MWTQISDTTAQNLVETPVPIFKNLPEIAVINQIISRQGTF